MPVPANETLTASYDADLLLQAEGVTKSFPGVKALSGMRFGLRKGEVRRSLLFCTTNTMNGGWRIVAPIVDSGG